jgi:hypothetical protein
VSWLLLARSHWKLVGIGLLCLALAVQTLRLGHRSNQLEKERIASNELRAELKRISTAKNEQAKRTEGNIEQAERGNKEADDRARKIEEAPTAPDCKTPPEILGADL